ncbi:hypothetical protein ACR820_22280 [Streptomyces netropsis]
MFEARKKNWLQKLSGTGLTVIESPIPTSTPTVLQAWQSAVNIEARPVAKISQSVPDALSEVDRQWLTHASNASIFAHDQSFLISVAGPGSLEFGWAQVRWSTEVKLASRLALDDGTVEFLAMSIDGRRTCAVTTEEYDFWILIDELE